MDTPDTRSIAQMRGFIRLTESLTCETDAIPEPEPAVVEMAPAAPHPLVPAMEAVIAHMRALMETSGNDDYDAGFDAASARWADVLENVMRRVSTLSLEGSTTRSDTMLDRPTTDLHDDDRSGDLVFEMAGLRSDRTGLPFYVWVSPKGGARHDVRIKVSPSHRYTPDQECVVALRPDIRVVHGHLDAKSMALLRTWIGLNLDALIAFWDEAIDQDDLFARLTRV